MKRSAIAAAVAVLFAGAAQAAVTEFTIYKRPNFQGQSHTVKGEVANLTGGFAGEVSSIVAKGGYWEVCTDDHFKGECRVIPPGEHPRLGDLDEKIVSVRFLGNDPRFAERADREKRLALREERREAREEWREARRADRWEDRRERREWRQAQGAIDLYGRPDFRGRSVRIDDNTADLWEHRFDGRASSAVVHDGTWQLCTEPGFRGHCAVLRPGEYRHLAQLDDRVSSARQIR